MRSRPDTPGSIGIPAFTLRKGVYSPFGRLLLDKPARGRPLKSEDIAPTAPYKGNSAKAVGKASDWLTGRSVRPKGLKIYAEVLAQYHRSREDKFENGQFLDRERTERRHVVAIGFEWMEKEVNEVAESE